MEKGRTSGRHGQEDRKSDYKPTMLIDDPKTIDLQDLTFSFNARKGFGGDDAEEVPSYH